MNTKISLIISMTVVVSFFALAFIVAQKYEKKNRKKQKNVIIVDHANHSQRTIGFFENFVSFKITTTAEKIPKTLSCIEVHTAKQQWYIVAAYGEIKDMILESDLESVMLISGEIISDTYFTYLAFPKEIYQVQSMPSYPQNYIFIRPNWDRAESKQMYIQRNYNHRKLEDHQVTLKHMHQPSPNISVVSKTIVEAIVDENRYCKECDAKIPPTMQICEMCGCEQ